MARSADPFPVFTALAAPALRAPIFVALGGAFLAAVAVYRERFTPSSANLQFLSCGEYEIQPGGSTQTACYPAEEALLPAK